MLYLLQLNKELKQMLPNFNRFFKVIVIEVGLFGSRIVDERHFPSLESAESYANTVTADNSVVLCSLNRIVHVIVAILPEAEINKIKRLLTPYHLYNLNREDHIWKFL